LVRRLAARLVERLAARLVRRLVFLAFGRRPLDHELVIPTVGRIAILQLNRRE
jgi:hypothetical protein